MLTLFHSPQSRSTRIIALIHELGAIDRITIEPVSVARRDGTGGADPKNPHPEGKVPYLVHNGVGVWESTAIALYLTELFPDAGLGRPIGADDRGRLLSWLAWYSGVLEPVIFFSFAEMDGPAIQSTFRGVPEVSARLSTALDASPYLMGNTYSVADLIISSAFAFAPQIIQDNPAVRDWVTRCTDRPALKQAAEYDAGLIQSVAD